MASLSFVRSKLEEVIRTYNLSVNSTEEQIDEALRKAHGGQDAMKWQSVLNVKYYGRLSSVYPRIFPQWVKEPMYDVDGTQKWVIHHEWGQGPNESMNFLRKEIDRLILRQAGFNELRFTTQMLHQYGAETLQQLEAALKPIESPRALGSPYTQNYRAETEVALRIGANLVVRLHGLCHWKAWKEVVYWMRDHPGYEELGPWSFLFKPTWKQNEDFTWVEIPDLQPNEECLDAVRRFGHLATFHEMARVISILARSPRPVTLQNMVRWIIGHKEWKDKNYDAEYLLMLLKTSDDVEMLYERIVVPDATTSGMLLNMANLLFGWASDEEVRKNLLETAQEIGLEQAWRMLTGVSRYYDKYKQSSAGMLEAVQKLGRETVLNFLPNPEEEIPEGWLDRFFGYVSWYQPAEGDQFETYEEFAKRAAWDSFGPQVQGWFTSLEEIIGREKVWTYYLGHTQYSSHDLFFFIPNMVSKLDAYSIGRIIEQVDNVTTLAQCVDAFTPDGTIFDGWRAFVKHTNLQRYAVVVPGDDPVVKAAVDVMLEAPGLNIAELRRELSLPRFISLAKGEMDEKALLQPAVHRYYITPAHELIRQALGTSGKVQRPDELRQKLGWLAKAYNKQKMVEYQMSKKAGQQVEVPEEIDLIVHVPVELRQDVAEMLTAYGVAVDEFQTFPKAIEHAIGIQPTAQKHKALFSKLNKLAHEAGLKKGIQDLLQHVPTLLEEQVWNLLKEHGVPMGPCLKAEILKKSDPRGWVGGNWAVCCASFGTSKNWDYMYKRSFSYFIVSLEKGLDDQRIIAWSVIDATRKADREVNPATATLNDVDAWVIDNIEGNHNYGQWFGAVAKIYSRFWKNHTKKRVMIGAWYNDIVAEGAWHESDASKIRTKWVPIESMEYSDFYGAAECQTWVLQKGADEE